jgi:hypothetical protein
VTQALSNNVIFGFQQRQTIQRWFTFRQNFQFIKIGDFVAFSGPKICPYKGPLFEKLQLREDTKSALITVFHCRLTISSKKKNTRPLSVMYERCDRTYKISKLSRRL